MSVFHADGQATFYQGDVIERLRELPENSVHTAITSPPYWGLRDYGVEGQLGLEATPEEFIAKMVAVFREVRRVLREDGTLWLNIGDSYAGSGKGPEGNLNNGSEFRHLDGTTKPFRSGEHKPKDLVGIPWALAFALRADGWWLRQDIIWAKPNPMPESVADRCTKSHEYLFLLTKSARYYYDQEAIREANEGGLPWGGQSDKKALHAQGENHGERSIHRPGSRDDMLRWYGNGRNKRSVWTIATEPYPEAHFATFPTALVKPCILAGTSERGVCSQCGGPWLREVEKSEPVTRVVNDARVANGLPKQGNLATKRWDEAPVITTVGWAPSCKHEAPAVPATVLDPFLGSGTTAYVAKSLGRHAVGIDLNPEYLELARRRCAQMGLMS